MKPVLVIGNITCDVIMQVEKLPTAQEDVIVHSQSMQLGGCAYNVANLFHLKRLPYKLIACVGTGIYGDYIKRQLKQEGYKQRLFSQEEHGCCYCLLDQKGERSFLAYHGSEYHFKKEWMNPYKNDEFALAYVCGLDIEASDGDAILDYLATLKCPIVFACAPRCNKISQQKWEKILALHPILHMNDKEAKQLTQSEHIEEALERLSKLNDHLVIVTLGEQGSVAKYKDDIVYVKANDCHVVDTIGAGDAHVSACMMKLIQKASLTEMLSYANMVSGKVVAKQGASFTQDEFDHQF
ncbi:MAG: carbohydrate kinase family protein [Erysipelotrichia bacterium]|nr:carbohydrate kinase family protein [Erysipelotrichia bacterium]NCC55401.1 carbohydrate kinase family protein [Erysipelotrichia bacterium]